MTGSVWQQIGTAAAAEFSDLGDAGEVTSVVVRLTMAMLLAGAIGWERERHDAAAGLRTHMLVGVGAALFVLVPAQAGMSLDGMARVIQGLVAGIGFLGAGAIIKLDRREQIHGLTTAASIWATASIGIAAGLGREMTAAIGTLFVLAILALLKRLDKAIERRQQAMAAQRRART